ncbi:hypothetical protein HS125_05220 [bacterium]|nr:hypothetical protein [bacterium]
MLVLVIVIDHDDIVILLVLVIACHFDRREKSSHTGRGPLEAGEKISPFGRNDSWLLVLD